MKRLIVAAVCLILAACSPRADEPGADREVVRFATDWRAQAEHGGFYQALATGEYEKRGLDVRIIQGGPAVNVPQLLAAGSVEMGMGSNSFIPLNLVREGAPVRTVAAFFQKDPQVLMAHPGRGIEGIADMKGRPFLLSDASLSAFWPWLKAKYSFTDDQARGNPSSAIFLQDERAIMQGYVTAEPFILKTQANFEPEVFLLADDGYLSYSIMVLAPDRLIADKPQVVRAFIEATAAGWRSYLHGDPAPGDALIRRDNPEMTQAQLDQAREKIRSYGLVESGDAAGGRIGAMTDARWAEFFGTVSAQGLYPADLDYRKAYTLDFLGAAP
jgi:NitT/TauT family transport system substrate-binding protein